MHFSRPSGQRFSWCRPWKRGAVGFFSNGYSSVNTLRNIVRKVTPNPATGSQRASLTLATAAFLATTVCVALGVDDRRRYRVPTGEGVEVLAIGNRGRRFGLLAREQHRDQRERDRDPGRDQQPGAR